MIWEAWKPPICVTVLQSPREDDRFIGRGFGRLSLRGIEDMVTSSLEEREGEVVRMTSDVSPVPSENMLDPLAEPRAQGVSRILISEEQLRHEVAVMARELDAQYREDVPLLVGVLTGAVTFVSDIMQAMTIPLEIDFMAISSYGAATKSTGVVRILKDLNEEIEGRRVIIIEDIVDSGLTLRYLLEVLAARNPLDVHVVALLKKTKRNAVDVQVDRVGFEIPDEFVVGYGLDHAGLYRNLPYVAVLSPSVYAPDGEGPGANGND